MPSDQIAAMSPLLGELREALKESGDWCLTFSVAGDERAWIQVTDELLNLSMLDGRLTSSQIIEALAAAGLDAELNEYQENQYLTLEVTWLAQPRDLCHVLDRLFLQHFGQSADYEIDAEMFEVSSDSSFPDSLPSIAELRRVTQSLAMLDAILSPEWEYRYFSFNNHWAAGEAMASMRNGCGDDWFLLFDQHGAALKGFAHELAVDSTLAERIQQQVPSVFSAFLKEPAFAMNDATFCYWRQTQDTVWQQVSCDVVDDGADELLELLIAGPEAYQAWAEEYYETEVRLEAVEAIFAHQTLSGSLVNTLNPDADLNEVCQAAQEIGYSVNFAAIN